MVIASGKVVGGRIELDSELPEGTSVTVLARDGDETFVADTDTERMLVAAIAQCERGETVPLGQLLGEPPRPRVSEPLPVVVSALAAEQVRTAEAWWLTNRQKAPGAIRAELERAATLITLGQRLAHALGTLRSGAYVDYISGASATISTTAS